MRKALLEYMYGPSAGQSNLARFKLPAFDEIYRRMLDASRRPRARWPCFARRASSSSPTCRTASTCIASTTDFSRPWIAGYRQPFFRNQSWHYIEVDGAMRAKSLA